MSAFRAATLKHDFNIALKQETDNKRQAQETGHRQETTRDRQQGTAHKQEATRDRQQETDNKTQTTEDRQVSVRCKCTTRYCMFVGIIEFHDGAYGCALAV